VMSPDLIVAELVEFANGLTTATDHA
jgi:hypothetical protein